MRSLFQWWPGSTLACFYGGYVLSCLHDRIWAFNVIFILQSLGGIQLVTINQLFQGVSGSLLSGYLGSWLDRHDRHFGVQVVLALNNLNVAVSAAFLAICLSMDMASRTVYITCLCLSILCCALANGVTQGENIAFTKDWVVVLVTRAEEGTTLSGITAVVRQNAMLTMIDQISAIAAPLAAGSIIAWAGLRVGCIVIVVWNVFAWAGEALLLHAVYRETPELATRIRSGLEEDRVNAPKQRNAIGLYIRQAVFPAAFALALHYLTVLAFDGVSMSFGKEQGLPASVLGMFQSVGAALGMCAAISYPFAERKLGVLRVGLVGLLAQLICLILCLVSVWLPGSPFDPSSYFSSITLTKCLENLLGSFDIRLAEASVNSTTSGGAIGLDWSSWTANGHSVSSVFMLFVGAAMGRFGLWMSDLAITQLMQEQVPEVHRGAVFGVQGALCLLLSVGKDVLAILLPDPRTFGLLDILRALNSKTAIPGPAGEIPG
ncbi:solute carrier family 40member 1 [Aphelenchoides avenae]|nr:solute carrier family 40member 1 [Aphelenchus avenae]